MAAPLTTATARRATVMHNGAGVGPDALMTIPKIELPSHRTAREFLWQNRESLAARPGKWNRGGSNQTAAA